MPPKGASRVPPAARGVVVPMTTQLFALGTKNPKNTVCNQEKLFHDQFVLIRHGERQDHVDRAWKGNALLPLYDPPLSNTGRKQSFETALKYYALQQEKTVEERIQGTFSAILVSPFHRCLETALIINIVAFEGSLAMFVDPQLSDWQQPKVFRTAPTLGGTYRLSHQAPVSSAAAAAATAKGKSGKAGKGQSAGAAAGQGPSLAFQPQQEALRSALEPFFQARAAERDEITETYKVTPDVAQRWSGHLATWFDYHVCLPVWTSEMTEAALTAQLSKSEEDLMEEQQEAETTQAAEEAAKGKDKGSKKGGVGGGGGGSSRPLVCNANRRRGDGFAQCGVPHPEGKADLARRCQSVEQARFLHSAEAAAHVPVAVQAAVTKEQRERLPKYFQVYDARPEQSRLKAGPPALLPPMHIMAVTHADVVAGLIDACCPRHLSDASGKSVPYCSVTVLRRHNNYYRIPPVEERPAILAGADGGRGKGKGHGRGGGGGGRGQSQAHLLFRAGGGSGGGASVDQGELSAEWHVDAVGSTDLLLTTRVVLQFN